MAYSTVGTKLAKGDGADPEVFTVIANVISITPPGKIADEIETTELDSNGYKQFILTLKALEEFVIVINYDPGLAAHAALLAAAGDNVTDNYQLQWPIANVAWTFPALLKGFKPREATAIGGGSALQAELTFRPNGVPDLADTFA